MGPAFPVESLVGFSERPVVSFPAGGMAPPKQRSKPTDSHVKTPTISDCHSCFSFSQFCMDQILDQFYKIGHFLNLDQFCPKRQLFRCLRLKTDLMAFMSLQGL